MAMFVKVAAHIIVEVRIAGDPLVMGCRFRLRIISVPGQFHVPRAAHNGKAEQGVKSLPPQGFTHPVCGHMDGQIKHGLGQVFCLDPGLSGRRVFEFFPTRMRSRWANAPAMEVPAALGT